MELFSNVTSTHKETYTNNIQQENQHLVKKPEELDKSKELDNRLKNEEQHSKKEMTKQELQELTAKLNKEMEPLNPDIKFHFNERIDDLVVNVIDKKTDRVIRKIPSDEAIKIMEKMRELVGALFDKKG